MDLSLIAYEYLSLCKIKVSQSYFFQRIRSHTDYPSLLSFVDTLDEMGIHYEAGQVDRKNLTDLRFPLLAHTPSAKAGFSIVMTMSQIENVQQRLLHDWDGVVLMVTPSQIISGKQHMLQLKQVNRNNNVQKVIALFALIFTTSIAVFYSHVSMTLFMVLCIIGMLVSGMLTAIEIGLENSLTNGICSTERGNPCKSLFDTRGSNILRIIKLNDAGVVWFLGGWIYAITASISEYSDSALGIIGFPCIFAFGITLFSLYYQWRIVKSWCKLCLATTIVVWLQSILVYFDLLLSGTFNHVLSFTTFLLFVFSFILASTWIVVKSLLVDKIRLSHAELMLAKWNRNLEVFELLLHKFNPTNPQLKDNPAAVGSKDAPIQLTVVINPQCRPCATEFFDLKELYERNSDSVALSFIFYIKDAEAGEAGNIGVVQMILAAIVGAQPTLTVLENWFHLMDKERFSEIYSPTKLQETYCRELMEEYRRWNRRINPSVTPYILLNGYKMPSQYRAADLGPFIKDLSASPPGKRERAFGYKNSEGVSDPSIK